VHTQDITLAPARALIERAIAKADHIGARGGFAVVGASGVLVSASRMDRGGAGGMARARSKAWISATQQIPSTVHHMRMSTLPPPIAAGFVACSPEAAFPGAGGMPITDDDGVVIAGFSASGASIGPFVDIGVDRRYLIAQGKPANSEDLIVLWALGLDYEGQHGDDAQRWHDAFGELPDEEGLGYTDPPAPNQPEHEWAVALADAAIDEARSRDVRVAVAIVDHRGDPIQHDCMDGAPTAGPFVAEALAAAAATFQQPSAEIPDFAAPLLPYTVAAAPGGLPVSEGDRVVAGLGIGGVLPALAHEIAAAVVA
jgi:uncharacterized protein GlcG (DUF336 family)